MEVNNVLYVGFVHKVEAMSSPVYHEREVHCHPMIC